jgi:hypothetical protein
MFLSFVRHSEARLSVIPEQQVALNNNYFPYLGVALPVWHWAYSFACHGITQHISAHLSDSQQPDGFFRCTLSIRFDQLVAERIT